LEEGLDVERIGWETMNMVGVREVVLDPCSRWREKSWWEVRQGGHRRSETGLGTRNQWKLIDPSK
jgi:hypothetical protein